MNGTTTQPLDAFLACSDYIDWQTPALLEQARRLAAAHKGALGVARACFEFVRDEIQHSWDFQRNPVTCRASDVLLHGTGYCYAKSHLLAALLRANGIPAGLCYQRLTIGDAPPFCLHGLNAVYLPAYGWYRLDPRGNKPGVNAQFSPPVEQLAFALVCPGEQDIDGIFSEPLPAIVTVLTTANDYQQVAERLPDIDCI